MNLEHQKIQSNFTNQLRKIQNQNQELTETNQKLQLQCLNKIAIEKNQNEFQIKTLESLLGKS
jgi:hypothetical protein